jgi:DNA-binding GntR family transcriptional regulator
MNNLDLLIPRDITSLRQQVTDRLRKAILYGHFEPGKKLIERDLCELLGISRNLLREALQHLQAEELITIIPHKGPMVAAVNAEEIREIYQVRQNLEALAGEGFALNATDQQVHRLRESLEYLHTPEASANPQNLLESKNSFYEILLEGCGNRVVGQMLKLLNNRVTLLRRLSLGQAGRLPETLRELEAIVAAIEARDAVRARELCAAHVAKAAEVVARSFQQSQKDFTPPTSHLSKSITL